jgi:predicted nucleic acid-binding protein
MNADAAVYLDSSALVKLVVSEAESDALATHLRDHPTRVSCALARVEVVRAARPHGDAATRRARELLDRLSLLHLDDVLLDAAADLGGETLRSLDAVHLAAARALGPSLTEIITYDDRMARAATSIDLVVSAPS